MLARRRRLAPLPAVIPLAVVALVALVLAACGAGAAAAPTLTDPVEILQAGAASLGEMKTLHVRGLVEGELPLEVGGGGGVPLSLDGTTLDADLDVPKSELAAELLATALFNLRINLVVVDGISYLRAPILTGDSWVSQPAEGGIGGDVGAALGGLAAFLARPELKPERLADTRCAGTECYSVQLTVPTGGLLDALGSLGASIPGLSGAAVGDATVTVGVRKDNLQLATLDLAIAAGGATPLTISLELSKVNEPVTIEAPPADEVKAAPG